MRGVSGDALNINAGQNALFRNDNFCRRVVVQRLLPGQRVIVPGNDDRRRALRQRAGLADDRQEVASLVEIGKIFQASFTGFLAGLRARGKTGGENAEDSLVGSARVTGERYLTGIFRLQQVGPVLRCVS